jgi:hypothetical protein
MTLDVKADNLTWSIPIKRRITIIRGDSGTGKTTLVDIISDNDSNAATVSFPLQISVVTTGTWEDVMATAVNRLIVFDELEAVTTSKFANLIKETENKGNYYLIFSRENIGTESYSMLNIAVSSILRFVTSNDGLNHYTEEYYNLLNTGADDKYCDKVVIEDRLAGKQFFKCIFGKNIIAAGSKSQIVPTIFELLSNNPCCIYVVVDMASFGCHMDSFYDEILYFYGNNVCFDPRYECFEELLANTNYGRKLPIVNDELADVYTFANKFISWEVYFEDLISRATNGTVLHHTHASWLKFCWKGNCGECRKMEGRACDFRVEGDKITYLLENTKYSNLLTIAKMRRGE